MNIMIDMRQKLEVSINELKDKHFRLPRRVHDELVALCKIEKRTLQDEIDFLVTERRKQIISNSSNK